MTAQATARSQASRCECFGKPAGGLPHSLCHGCGQCLYHHHQPDYAAFSGRVDSGDPLVYDYKREPDPVLDKWIPQSEIPPNPAAAPSSNTFSTRRLGRRTPPNTTVVGCGSAIPFLGKRPLPFPQKVQQPVYDADGNLTASQFLQYMYDAENRLTRVHGWGFIMDMTYDYRHRRVEQTYTRWDGNAWVVESKRPLRLRRLSGGGGGGGGGDHRGDRCHPGYFARDLDLLLGLRHQPTPSAEPAGFGGLLLIDDHPHTSATFPATMQTATSCSSSGRVTANWMPNSMYDPYGNLIRAEGDAVDKTPFRYQTNGPRLRG